MATDSRLLSLPLELVTQITDVFDDQCLPTLRLTCRTIENATFERFADTFKFIRCCVFYEERWQSLNNFLNGSSRLVQAVRRVKFTTDPLEGRDWMQVQLAPNSMFPNIRAAQMQFDIFDADERYPYEPLGAGGQKVAPALVHSVLHNLAKLPVSVEFDLSDNPYFRYEEITFHEQLLVAIATTGCHVDDLVMSHDCMIGIEDVTTYLQPRLLSCVAGMLSFSFEPNAHGATAEEVEFDRGRLNVIQDMLHNAKKLSILTLELSQYRDFINLRAISELLLLANDFTTLTSLRLWEAVVSEKQLVKALVRCSPTLQLLNMRGVHLADSKEGWLAIFRVLSTMPNLESLQVLNLAVGEGGGIGAEEDPRVDFGHIKHQDGKIKKCAMDLGWDKGTPGMALEGKEVIAAVLDSLLHDGSLPLARWSLDLLIIEAAE